MDLEFDTLLIVSFRENEWYYEWRDGRSDIIRRRPWEKREEWRDTISQLRLYYLAIIIFKQAQK